MSKWDILRDRNEQDTERALSAVNSLKEEKNNSCFHRSLPTRPIPAGHNAYDVLPVLFLIW